MLVCDFHHGDVMDEITVIMVWFGPGRCDLGRVCMCMCLSPRSQTALNNGFTAIGGHGWALWKIHLTTGAGRHRPSQPRTTTILPRGEGDRSEDALSSLQTVLGYGPLKQKQKRNLFSYCKNIVIWIATHITYSHILTAYFQSLQIWADCWVFFWNSAKSFSISHTQSGALHSQETLVFCFLQWHYGFGVEEDWNSTQKFDVHELLL